MEIKLQALFPTYMTSVIIEDHEHLNATLEKDCYRLKESNTGVSASNLNGWHSTTDLFSRSEESFKEISEHIIAFAQSSVKRIHPNLDLSKYNQEMNGWININPPGALNVPHDHPEWEMSGTYYVKAPEGNNPQDGCFEFIDPKTNSSLSKIYNINGVERRYLIKPTAGLLIGFPSYVKHWVRPNNSNSDRISIAWNYRIVQ